MGAYTTGIYPLKWGGHHAGSGVSLDLGGENFRIGYNATPSGAQIGKYNQERFGGSLSYTDNLGGVNNKYISDSVRW